MLDIKPILREKIWFVANWILDRVVILIGSYSILSGYQAWKLGSSDWIPMLYLASGIIIIFATCLRLWKKRKT